MKPCTVFCLLALSGCAGLSPLPPAPEALPPAAPSSVARPEPLTEPVRLQTRAGSFLVHPHFAPDLARLLAGETPQQLYYAGAD